MSEADVELDSTHQSDPRAKRAARLTGSVIGVLLFVAAIVTIAMEGDKLKKAWDEAANAPLWLVVVILALPALNWLVISASFQLLTRRFGEVRFREMLALVGSAWLLNYLPMRPGMFGRLAYHKRYNGIRVKDSVRVLVESVVLSVAAIVLLVVLAMIVPENSVIGYVILSAPLIITAPAAVVLKRFTTLTWRFVGAFAFRYIDAIIWAGRYAAVLWFVGAPVGLHRAALAAAASQAVQLIPVAGNGLGFREWAISLTVEDGLVADVTNRAAEVAVALVIGLIAGAWLAALVRSRDRQSQPPATTE